MSTMKSFLFDDSIVTNLWIRVIKALIYFFKIRLMHTCSVFMQYFTRLKTFKNGDTKNTDDSTTYT